MLSLRIVRSDHFYPCFPRDDLFHLVEKFLPLRRFFPVSVFNIRECYLIFHTVHLPCFPLLYCFSYIFARLTLISVSLKNEMFYNRSRQGIGTKQFIPILDVYLIWYREKRIKLSLHGLSSIEYRRKLGLI